MHTATPSLINIYVASLDKITPVTEASAPLVNT